MKKKAGDAGAKGNYIKKLTRVTAGATLSSLLLVVALVTLALLVPPATAAISSFTITPDRGLAGETVAYKVVLNTTAEFKWFNATLLAGFGVQTPGASELVARVDLQNETKPNYGYIKFTANASDPANKLDVFADIGGDTAEATVDVDYSAGGTTRADSPFAGGSSYVRLTLPTKTVNGCLNLSLPMKMRNISSTFGKYVKNPSCGNYIFLATVDSSFPAFPSNTLRIKPAVTNPTATPNVIPDDTDNNPLWGEASTLSVSVDCDNLASVTVDLSQIGGSPVQPMANAGGNLWLVPANASAGTTPGTYLLPVNATDTYGNSNTTEKISLRVQKNGDVQPYDGDGKVTFLKDALYLLRHTRNVPGYENIRDNIAEVTGDGKVTFLKDALYLLRHTRNVPGYEILK